MTWREQIENIGVNKVAQEMGVKYPTVYKYVNPEVKAFPDNRKDGMMKPLCSAMSRLLTPEEFVEFMNSLSSEITGFVTETASASQGS